MAISLDTSNVLASSVVALFAVDPSSGGLVDLKRPSVTFSVDAGVTTSVNANGVGILTTAGTSAETRKGFSWSSPISGQSNLAGFAGTVLLVSQFTRGDTNLMDYKVANPIGGAGDVVYAPMPTIAQGHGNVAFLSATAGDNFNAARAHPGSQVGAVHSLAVTMSNAAGGWTNVSGRLFVDGVDTGITSMGGAGSYTINGFNQSVNQLWVGDLHYLVFFDRVLTTAEIASLHAPVQATGRLPLVSGYAAAEPAPAPTAPAAPVVGVASSTQSSVTVAVTGATHRRINGGAWAPHSGAAATFTGLVASTAYTVEFKAVANSLDSAVASKVVTTLAVAPPQPDPDPDPVVVDPTGVTALKAYRYDGSKWVESPVVAAVEAATGRVIAFYKL